ncbi:MULTISPECIES: DMT family transporter [unclassified Sphingobacterium]|uniref:EamA family transporter n=1 Tax=unclassified Sphingobacterium TaxID=2609468 RepID=UPI001046B339|nr:MULTISPECIES: EamA family transporter [unclassified Sphingobacterium]MCS3554461.1 drug/metabolite transporter (DMT)-like permease [Sphingobacterium sp. JUb21]TCR07452.1 threonine/homoserine efflux transporter RhtA [Sphingobacterium sp. JUb20]
MSTKKSTIYKGFSLAIAAAILWGVSGTLAQFLFQKREINVEWLITVRMLLSGICLLSFAKTSERAPIFKIWKTKNDRLQLLAFSIFGMLAVQYTYFAAIKHSNAATATVLQYAGPIIMAIYLACKYKRLPSLLELFAIILAIVGTFLLVTNGNINTLAISNTALFFGLASAVALAIYTLMPAELLSKHKSSVVIGWSLLCGGIAFSFMKAPWDIQGVWDTKTYLFTALIILLGTVFPFYFYLTAVTLIGGQKASLLASAEPLSATLLAVSWLHIPFSLWDWIGTFCIISTVFLLSKK